MTADQLLGLVREGYDDRIDPRVIALLLSKLSANLFDEIVEEQQLQTDTLINSQ